ncbi:hypothetical protein AAG570_011775 [Ranatra chinensis]|uniref:Uncharacterized protein n=1 Tax=Ranatra chinensis TaxID=642074 RepID=A0ABD0Z583_9HEMI
MVVHSVDKKSSHVIKQPYFYPDPKYGHYSLNGVNFTLMDGLFSAVVGQSKKLNYFLLLSAGREFRAKTRLLKDPEASTKNFWEYEDLGYQRKFHASAMAVNSNGIMVFPNLEDNSIIAWNSNMPYRPENFRVIAKDVENLQFPSGVKIIGNELYLLTSRIQNVMVGNIPKDEVNYRVLVGDLEKMLVNGRPYRETSSPSNEFADRFGSEPEDVASTTTDQTTAEESTTDSETGSDPPENAVWEVVRNGKNGN